MIIFKKIRAKNFLSIGDNFLEYDLTKDHLTLLKGKNSSGKSSLIEAFTFGLYKKTYRNINLPQLVNNINQKNCVVEIEFDKDNTNWFVRRGLAPNVFEIYKNGELLDQQSSVIEQQKWLEQNVLKMTYKTFIQIVILGSGSYIPFMQLTPADRREVVEDLLDIKMFSSMNALIKEKIKNFKDNVKLLSVRKDSIEEKVQMQSEFIEQIEQRSKQEIQEKTDNIGNIFAEIEQLEATNQTIQESIDQLTQQLNAFDGSSDLLKELLETKTKLGMQAQLVTETYKFFKDNDTCPTCSQTIDVEFKKQKQKQSQKEIKEIKETYDSLIGTIDEESEKQNQLKLLNSALSEKNQELRFNQQLIHQQQKSIAYHHKQIQKLNEQLENRNAEHQKLESYESQLEQSKSEIAETKENIYYYDYVHSLLKDSGVKSKIVEKYLRIINQQINKYLDLLELYVNFTLDSEFNEEITTPTFDKFSYGNFSEGQKRRVDLALLFTWRYVTAIKNSASTNLLICDEILDGSMDEAGHNAFLRIVREELKECNVFVISHRDGIEHRFDSVIEVEKRGNFTVKTED
jgi:DNA repair exonuclease SbcCD ATPase subunit